MFVKSSLFVLAVGSVSESEWAQWKEQYGRVYNGEAEENFRRTVYDGNIVKAAELQQLNPEAEFGSTLFSDWTLEEVKERLLNYIPSNESLPEFDVTQLPTKVQSSKDWTGIATTPVKNQGSCGSCWAFSATEQIESDLMLQHNTKLVLGPQQLVDCTSRGPGSRRNGCNGGFPSAAYQVIESLGGIEKESDYRYTARNGVCRYSRSQAAVRVTGYHSVGRGNENAMQSYISSTGPLSVCVDASTWSSYRGGVLTQCGRSVDHCVQLVGYSGSVWKVRNSWGGRWGENGFIRIRIGQDLCSISSSPTKVSAQPIGFSIQEEVLV